MFIYIYIYFFFFFFFEKHVFIFLIKVVSNFYLNDPLTNAQRTIVNKILYNAIF